MEAFVVQNLLPHRSLGSGSSPPVIDVFFGFYLVNIKLFLNNFSSYNLNSKSTSLNYITSVMSFCLGLLSSSQLTNKFHRYLVISYNKKEKQK